MKSLTIIKIFQEFPYKACEKSNLIIFGVPKQEENKAKICKTCKSVLITLQRSIYATDKKRNDYDILSVFTLSAFNYFDKGAN
jgi:hypothetical protein